MCVCLSASLLLVPHLRETSAACSVSLLGLYPLLVLIQTKSNLRKSNISTTPMCSAPGCSLPVASGGGGKDREVKWALAFHGSPGCTFRGMWSLPGWKCGEQESIQPLAFIPCPPTCCSAVWPLLPAARKGSSSSSVLTSGAGGR